MDKAKRFFSKTYFRRKLVIVRSVEVVAVGEILLVSHLISLEVDSVLNNNKTYLSMLFYATFFHFHQQYDFRAIDFAFLYDFATLMAHLMNYYCNISPD